MATVKTLLKRFGIPAIILSLPTLFASAQTPDLVPLAGSIVHKTLATVAFGDSNTTDFAAGIVNWYERVAALSTAHPIQRPQLNNTTIVYALTFYNQSMGGKMVAPTMLGHQNAQYDIVAALNNITHADFVFVMLVTN